MPPETPEQNEYVMRPETQLAIFITEGIRRKGISLQKLSELSGIAMKHLEHMSGGNAEQFPPAPYLRSYLMILGRVLDFDGRELWNRIRTDELAVHSGEADRLTNMGQTISVRGKIIWLAIIGLLLAVYLLFQLPKIIGKPTLEIGYPTEDVTTTNISPITIAGLVKNGDEFFVNGERIPLGSDGLWEKNIDLQEGLNTVELRAQKFLGQDVKILRQIVYTPTNSSIKNTSGTKDTSATSTEGISSSTPTTTKKKTNL